MEIRIRRAGETSSRHLTTSSIDKLDQVIPVISRWGIAGEQPDMTGQFVIEQEDGRAYFEVVVSDE